MSYPQPQNHRAVPAHIRPDQIWIAGGAVWLLAVVGAYYVVHKPFAPRNLVAIFDSLANLLLAACLLAIAAAAGRRLLKGFDFASALERIMFATALGLGVISLATFGLGLLGALNSILFWGLLLLSCTVLRSDLVALWRDLRAIRVPALTRFDRLLRLFIFASLGLAALTALAPVTSWDAQAYHLLAGKLALEQGRIGPPGNLPLLNYPSLVEMLYLATLCLKDAGPSALLHFGYLILTVAALGSFCCRFSFSRTGLLASALLLAVPSFLLVSAWPYADTALALYSTSALYALIVGVETHQGKWLVLAGIMAGLAAGVKYIGLFVPLALLIVLWPASGTLGWRRALYLLVPCILVASPWYIRNLAFTGNPFYPFFFGGEHWNAFRGDALSLPGTGLAAEPLRLVLLPWEVTVLGQEGKELYQATVGPLLFMLLPFLPLAWRQPGWGRVHRSLLTFAGALYLFWAGGVAVSSSLAQVRYLFAAFPSLALLAATSLETLPLLDRVSFSFARFARATVLLVLSLSLFGQALSIMELNPVPYLAGFEPRESFLKSRLSPGFWDALQYLSGISGAHVLFLWEDRAFYAAATARVQPDQLLDNYSDYEHRFHDAAGIAAELNREGYTHLLINRWGLDFMLGLDRAGLSRTDIEILRELTTVYGREVYGTIPLEVRAGDEGRLSLVGVEQEPYAIYQLIGGNTMAARIVSRDR